MRLLRDFVLGALLLAVFGLLSLATLWSALMREGILEVQVPMVVGYGAIAFIGYRMCVRARRHE